MTNKFSDFLMNLAAKLEETAEQMEGDSGKSSDSSFDKFLYNLADKIDEVTEQVKESTQKKEGKKCGDEGCGDSHTHKSTPLFDVTFFNKEKDDDKGCGADGCGDSHKHRKTPLSDVTFFNKKDSDEQHLEKIRKLLEDEGASMTMVNLERSDDTVDKIRKMAEKEGMDFKHFIDDKPCTNKKCCGDKDDEKLAKFVEFTEDGETITDPEKSSLAGEEEKKLSADEIEREITKFCRENRDATIYDVLDKIQELTGVTPEFEEHDNAYELIIETADGDDDVFTKLEDDVCDVDAPDEEWTEPWYEEAESLVEGFAEEGMHRQSAHIEELRNSVTPLMEIGSLIERLASELSETSPEMESIAKDAGNFYRKHKHILDTIDKMTEYLEDPEEL